MQDTMVHVLHYTYVMKRKPRLHDITVRINQNEMQLDTMRSLTVTYSAIRTSLFLLLTLAVNKTSIFPHITKLLQPTGVSSLSFCFVLD